MKNLNCAFLVLACALWKLSCEANAQNLLPNPGFETNTGCPSGIAQLALASPYFTPSGHTGSADYHNVCSSSTLVDVPGNAFGNQAAHGGNAYIGFALFYLSTPGFREYVQVALTSPLVAGQNYIVRFWVSLGDNSTMATDDLQFYFSSTPTTWTSNWFSMTSYTPQAAIPSGTYLNNKAGWTQVSATFTAAGGENFMTMGNFLTDAATSTQSAGAGSYDTGYIYVDDMELLVNVVVAVDFAQLQAEAFGAKVNLDWETSMEADVLRFEVERSVDDYRAWQLIGSREAAGNSNEAHYYSLEDQAAIGGIENHYRIKIIDLNGEASYSNAVSARPEIESSYLAPLYPNPVAAGETMQAQFVSKDADGLELHIIDLQGRTVLQRQLQCQAGENRLALPIQDLSPGQYLLRLTGGGQQIVQRIQVR